MKYKFPNEDILNNVNKSKEYDSIINDRGKRLISVLKNFGIEATLIGAIHGASVTMYEIRLAKGIKVNRLENIVKDIELNLPALHVRIIPIPSKLAIGVEVPNTTREIIGFKEMLGIGKEHKIPFLLGKNLMNERISIDITNAPHLLIAGATGSGKSVCINNLIASVIYNKTPDEVRMVMVDPKMVELSVYNGIPHLIGHVIVEPNETIKMLDACINEMNRRYNLLKKMGCRSIASYNNRIKDGRKMKYILVIIDEFADLMATNSKELEPRLAKLTAMSRAVGIHMVLATQRPSSDVITGVIKANIPSRIAFQVSSSVNSRIILDESGAEKLLGKGDMLLSESSSQSMERIQGAYLSDDEVERIVDSIKIT